MIRLSDFILEKKQKSRKEELINYLKGKNYPNYIETLEDMLKDPKTRALIERRKPFVPKKATIDTVVV